MQDIHREAIQKNFSSLVEQTDLDLMVAALHEKGVFSDAMIEPYRDHNKGLRERKRLLYRHITMRGPEAFSNLLDALSENGYWNLVRELDPTSALHISSRPPPYANTTGVPFLSLTEKKKEQNDSNKNHMKPQTTAASKIGAKHLKDKEVNGNDTAQPPSDSPSTSSANDPDNTIPQFNVIKSTKFFENEGKELQLYRTRCRSRGLLYVFTYISFKNDLEEFRAGARVDADNLRYLFTELGFKVFSYFDLTYQETEKTLAAIKDGICSEGTECVFVVFSSHGHARSDSGDVDIRCSDGRLIPYSQVINHFNNVNFPRLKNIPKVFIFQNCRGNKTEFALNSPPTHIMPPLVPRALRPPPRAPTAAAALAQPAPGTQQDGVTYRDYDEDEQANKDLRDRLFSDILVVNSTVPGHVSNRDPTHGSWYIQALCDVFAARAHDCHVDELFTLVDEQLRRRFRTQTSSVERWGFNKLLYLHPGLYED